MTLKQDLTSYGRRTPVKDKTEFLKTPQAYGLPTLERIYTMFYEDFFKHYGFEKFPAKIKFTFSDAKDYLGKFICNGTFKTNEDGTLAGFTFSNPRIELSNAFDLTPEELGNVIAHEMVHLCLAAGNADPTMQDALEGWPVESFKENALGHGEQFQKIAKELNEDEGTNVTITNDLPLVQNNGASNIQSFKPTYYICMAENDNVSITSMPEDWIVPYIDRNKDIKNSIIVCSCRDNNFNRQYGTPDDQHAHRTTVTFDLFSDYMHSGILKDETDKYLNMPSPVLPNPSTHEGDDLDFTDVSKKLAMLTDEQKRMLFAALMAEDYPSTAKATGDNVIKFPTNG